MHHSIKRLAVSVAAAGLLIATAGATAASASTHPIKNGTVGCLNAAPLPVACGGQEEHNTGLVPGGMVWAVRLNGRPAAKNDRIIVQPYSQSRQVQDFSQINVDGGSGSGGPNKRFQYSPNGDNSGLCISDINTASGTQLRLRPCNNSQFQDFTPVVDNYSGSSPYFVGWESQVNTNHVIQDPSFGVSGTVLTVGDFQFAADNQAWTYVN